MGNQGVNSSWHLDEIAGEKCFTSERWTLNRMKQYLIRKTAATLERVNSSWHLSANSNNQSGLTASGAISAHSHKNRASNALAAAVPTMYLLHRIQKGIGHSLPFYGFRLSPRYLCPNSDLGWRNLQDVCKAGRSPKRCRQTKICPEPRRDRAKGSKKKRNG